MEQVIIDERTKKILENHEKRISALESLFSKKQKIFKSENKKTLSDYILELRDNEFFSQMKTAEEVNLEVQKIYSCEPSRVAVALFRLADSKQLRIATKELNDKKFKAYVW